MEDWLADWEIERDTCTFHGGSYSECPDADRDWFPQMSVCYPTMQEKAAQRRWESLHHERPYHDGSFESWSKEPSLSHPFKYDDGVMIWVSKEDLSPADDFLEQKSPGAP